VKSVLRISTAQDQPSIVASCLKQTGLFMADAVELRGIHKTFDRFIAVDHLSLKIREGSVYGLLGPNGAARLLPSG